ncbi:hypothetical protein B0H10DRAFT_1120087 [Mycena sp. CBHHK59/15]|nr:hypothetical protein B0H10DRAFT_1120087 [Mycena sp. CBHHK59/15]
MSEPYNPYIEAPLDSPPLSPISPNRALKKQPSDFKDLPTLPSHGSPTNAATRQSRLGYYPASLVLLAIWIIFVAVLLWLLESAVAHGPRSLTPLWTYTTLPSLLLTVFAQGHGAVTAMHLARVSVSALHSRRTAPNTWAEVFWMSDRMWQGPVGLLSTVFAASRLRVRTSGHFVLCAVTCLVALVTPIILSRAYPIRSIAVLENTTATPNSLSVVRMGAVDAYAELGTGMGSWTTALPVTDVYNTSVFLPPGASRDNNPTDFFFAGDLEGKTATLPGLRLKGQCVPIDSPVTDFTGFAPYCQTQIPQTPFMGSAILTPSATNLTMSICCNSTWASLFSTNPAVSTNVAYIYLTSSNSSNLAPGDGPGASVSGMIRCDSQVSTGTATLSGADGTYTSFSEAALYNETQGGEPLLDPLFVLAYYLGSGTSHISDDQIKAAIVRALGFVGLSDGTGAQLYSQPSLAEMATAFWRGVSYTVSGIGLLSRTNETTYPAVARGTAAVYVRERHFAAGAYALLGIWLLLLIAITARSFRPTFGGSFDSYVTAKLVLDKPGLVGLSGELVHNENLRAPFGVVDHDSLGL